MGDTSASVVKDGEHAKKRISLDKIVIEWVQEFAIFKKRSCALY